MTSTQSFLSATGLQHSQTVPRHLVHRRSLAEVFPTDSVADGDEILVACQLPVGHALYNDRAQPYADPLLILEAARQSALVYNLRHRGATSDVTFVVRSTDLEISRPIHLAPGSPPVNVVFRCMPSDLFGKNGAVVGERLDMTLYVDDSACATITFTYTGLPPKAYQALREPGLRRALDHTPAEPPEHQSIDAASLGRKNPDNVVIATSESDARLQWPVIVRTDHPGYFDHPLDHVSAAVMVEACRQAAHAACPSPASTTDLVSMCARFSAFAEHGPTLYARVDEAAPGDGDDTNLTVSLVQMYDAIATVDMTLRPIEVEA